MITLNFRFGDARTWNEPVRDLYIRVGRHFYVHQIARTPSAFLFVVPGFVLTFTHIL